MSPSFSELGNILEDVRSLRASMGFQTQVLMDKMNLDHWHATHKTFLTSFLAIAVTYLLTRLVRRRKLAQRNPPLDNDTAQALCSVFAPTSVAWPMRYNKFFKIKRIKRRASGHYIELNINELLRHIYDGDLEIRDSKDLGLLFARALRVYGWEIGIFFHGTCWLKTLKWIVGLYFAQVEASTRITTQGLACQWPLSCALGVASRPRPSFDLDFVPYHDIESEIRRIQSLHQRGNTTTIEFSCLGSGIRLMNSDFMLCVMPLLPNENQTAGQVARINRTSTPLFISLQDIIALLSSTGTLSVKSIDNISAEHSAMLYNLEQELVYDRNLREEHIKDVGLEGWRKDRLMLAWEAGLLDSKKLVRWRIKLHM